ncbi:uncharacterized protein ACLA_072780 [Aspergillus clavatus NRRL 1]|uniref:Uncharacterized protein n=1 Tax=Aspergillus clavatus (strain ATCC 1007 / CBS 513.65 / DSM 816 / NCTC 3887 / NRRL 1 / QM 1276 / 107) TaxID=344612 RepID=A1C774_ASPCL|nr:uncharacterized protein ACLA_072780 [Aspergillus clavatus NRRL 1]EAW14245.1 conserved hypothetical protein [Aspergillus clavatus NRRL 1]
MALYIKIAADNSDILSYHDIITKIIPNSSMPSIYFSASDFTAHILTYATLNNIVLADPLEDLDVNVDLPELDIGDLVRSMIPDAWNFVPATALYARKQGSYVSKSAIGGDDLDITIWPSRNRKACSFNGKDPMGTEATETIKKGMVLVLA